MTFAPAQSSARLAATTFKGVGDGTVDRLKHFDDGHAIYDSHDVYKAHFTYTFRISAGQVVGTGTGTYLSATWDLKGTNEGQPFGCSPPVSTSGFRVEVSGSVSGETIKLRFLLPDAQERNADYDCGANFTGFATDSAYVADSLAKVIAAQPGGVITLSRTAPSIPPLHLEEHTGDSKNFRTILHDWTITITAVSGAGSGGSGGGGGGSGKNPKPSGPCTINGTAGNDVLTGTSGRDVICGFGGNDVIRGAGGDDALRGGSGNDRLYGGAGNDAVDGGPGADQLFGESGRDLLLAKDGRRDVVSGGPQRDRAIVDKQLDHISGVEQVG